MDWRAKKVARRPKCEGTRIDLFVVMVYAVPS